MDFKCLFLKNKYFENKVYISWISHNLEIQKNNVDSYQIPDKYIISRVFIDCAYNINQIIIIGRLTNDLPKK